MKYETQRLLSSFFFLGTCLIIAAPSDPCAKCCDPRIDRTRPSVYVDFVREGPCNSFHTGESKNGIWLRLHNNTDGISYCLCLESLRS